MILNSINKSLPSQIRSLWVSTRWLRCSQMVQSTQSTQYPGKMRRVSPYYQTLVLVTWSLASIFQFEASNYSPKLASAENFAKVGKLKK